MYLIIKHWVFYRGKKYNAKNSSTKKRHIKLDIYRETFRIIYINLKLYKQNEKMIKIV